MSQLKKVNLLIWTILAVVKNLHHPKTQYLMSIIDQFSRFYTDLATMQVSELENIYSTDVVFIDPIAEHNGLAAVEQYFSKLLKNAKYCEFDIHYKNPVAEQGYVVSWTMKFTSKRINKGRPVAVDGLTIINIQNDKIVFHRDYYDLGQMLYEHIPMLGRIIKKIKRSMG
ncbi:nuclear transport factor 2 family protein [Glaciecola sp. XM2]|uniref:nuclear transport factor 2 family protein n=1 Tax=Glaciecola sp. XM2 TaxID=1914931 RepID=UPI003321DF6D